MIVEDGRFWHCRGPPYLSISNSLTGPNQPVLRHPILHALSNPPEGPASYTASIIYLTFLHPYHQNQITNMDVTQIYAIAAGGVFILFIIANCLHYIKWLVKHIAFFTSRYLTYCYLVRRHRFLGPWTRAGILVQVIYIAINVFCLTFQVSKLSQVSLRAGTLSLINMIPLFAGSHLSFLADVLGVSLATYRRIHRSGSLVSFALGLCHVMMAVIGRGSLTLATPRYLFGLIASNRHGFCLRLADFRREGSHCAV